MISMFSSIVFAPKFCLSDILKFSKKCTFVHVHYMKAYGGE